MHVYNVKKLHFQANLCEGGYLPKLKTSNIVET